MQAPRRRKMTIWEAVTLGRAAEVQRFLAVNPDGGRSSSDARDAGGWTLLMHAAVQGHHALARWMIESARADPNLSDLGAQQRTPLLHAAAAGKLKVVRVLLAFEAVDMDFQDARGCSALMLAAWNGHFEIVKELLVRGVRIDSRDQDAWTALTFAARFGRLDIAHLLLERGAQRDPASVSNDRTPLMHAVLMGHIEIARVLLDYGADATKTDRHGNSIVMLALQGDVMPRNNQQESDVEEDARLGMVQMLVKHGAPPTLSNLEGQSPRQLATEEGLSRIAAFLKLCQPSEMRTTPLLARQQTLHVSVDTSEFFEAVERGDVPQVLEQIDSMLHARDSRGLTPLLVAAKNDQLEILQLCLSRGANLSVRDDATARSALHFAASAGSAGAVRLLLSEGADVGMKDAKGLTPIDTAVASGHADIVEELYSSNATVRNISTIDRQTIWHRAVHSGSADVVRFLVQLTTSDITDNSDGTSVNVPPDVNALDRSGYSALHTASCSGMVEAIALLLSAGADPNILTKVPRSVVPAEKQSGIEAEEEPTPEDKSEIKPPNSFRKECALHLAVLNDHYDAVELLLRQTKLSDNPVQVDIRNDHYQTPLLVAVACGYSNIAVLLLDSGADIEASAPSGISPEVDEVAGQTSLFVATMHGHEKLVKTLLEYGARVDVTTPKRETPISVAPSEALRSVLSLYQSSQQFQQRCFALIHPKDNSGSEGSTPISTEDLLDLAALVTSAYDLRFLLTLSLRLLDETRAKSLPTAAIEVGVIAALKRAFELILMKKLVFDDDACVFFRLALEQCSKRGLVSSRDFMRWKLEATKVNMESADWVVDLKRQVYQNSWRAQTTAKNVEMLAHGIKKVHEMALENREGVIACAQRLKQLEYQLEDANRIMATAMSQMHAEVVANSASIREAHNKLGAFEGKLEQFQQRLQVNEANISEVASHLHQMQETQIASIERQRKHQMMKHGFGLVASLVGFVFAPMLKEVFDTVLDLSDPLEIARCAISDTLGGGDGIGASDIMDLLLSTSGGGEGDDDDNGEEDSENPDDGANGASESEATSILKPAVQMILAKFGIQNDEFTTALRQEIVIQHPELVAEREARGKIVVLGTHDSEGVHTVMGLLEREQVNLTVTLEEMRVYSQQIAAAAQPETPTLAPVVDDLTIDLAPIDGGCGGVENLHVSKVSDVARQTDPSWNQLEHDTSTVRSGTTTDITTKTTSDLTTIETKVVPPKEQGQASKRVSLSPSLPTSEEQRVLELLEDISRFSFHDAVLQSGGDLSLFEHLTAQSNADAAAETMTVTEIVYVGAAHTTITAAEYAYYLGFDDVGDKLVDLMRQQGKNLPSRPAQPASIDVEADLADFPYHYSVFASGGDVEECEMLLEVVHDDDDPIDAQVSVELHGDVRKSCVAMSAVELASKLGYVDVVKHFLVKLRVKTSEKGVVLLHRAREQAKMQPPRIVLLEDSAVQ